VSETGEQKRIKDVERLVANKLKTMKPNERMVFIEGIEQLLNSIKSG